MLEKNFTIAMFKRLYVLYGEEKKIFKCQNNDEINSKVCPTKKETVMEYK